MIREKELRIGNLIADIHGKTICVNSIYEGGINLSGNGYGGIDREHYLPECSGIPLTPEILEACGFEDYSSDQNGNCLRLRFDSRELAWYVQDGFLRYQTQSTGWTTQFDHIKYLHQLQNLFFALTGSELKVDLK
jgi:hypothetical protein